VLSAENLASIESEGRRLVTACRQDPQRPVAQYDGWTLADLASHMGSIHGRTSDLCRELPAERISAPRLPSGQDPVDWCERMLDEMLAALTEANPTSPVWTFDESGVLGSWETRMVPETGMHRWDAEQAVGRLDPLTRLVAVVGLEEFGGFWLRSLGDLQTLEVVATDIGDSWVYGPGEPTARVEGSASDLYLRLMQRSSAVVLPDDWASAVADMAKPVKR
jgi:uncharacterized protein (TIGR03083 family)